MTPATATTETGNGLFEDFLQVRRQSEQLCRPLTPEDMMVQSCAEASPAKWHLAHTTWFFETFLLREFLPGYQEFHPDFRWLFNSYYNSVSDQPEKKLRASFSRPPVEAILAYRQHVESAMACLLSSHPGDEVMTRIVLGLHHEQQHQEFAGHRHQARLMDQPAAARLPGRKRSTWEPLRQAKSSGSATRAASSTSVSMATASPSITSFPATPSIYVPFLWARAW